MVIPGWVFLTVVIPGCWSFINGVNPGDTMVYTLLVIAHTPVYTRLFVINGTNLSIRHLRTTSGITVKNVRNCSNPRINQEEIRAENNPSPQGKQEGKGRETRYREHLCTRKVRIVQPLKSCHQTPRGREEYPGYSHREAH